MGNTVKIGQYYRNNHTGDIGRVTIISSRLVYLERGNGVWVGQPTFAGLAKHWTLIQEAECKA